MKKIVLVLIVMVLGIIAGCSANGEKVAQTENQKGGNEEKSNFPTKDIRIVVPYDPGGTSDLTARKIVQIIQKEKLLPVNINVVNLPGANTRNGLEEVLKADADGHTVLLHHSTLNAMNAVGQIDISYTDYNLISQVLYTPSVLVGNADSEHKTFDEYVEAAKQNPGSVSVGITNIGSTTHLAYESMMAAIGEPDIFQVIPYQSGGDLITAHLGGQVDLRMASTPDSIQYVESGDVVPLVTSSLDRHFHESLKDAVSFSELGLDSDVAVRFGFYAPKETPDSIISIFEDVLKEVVESPEFKEFSDQNGAMVSYLNQKEFIEINEVVQSVFDKLAENIDLN